MSDRIAGRAIGVLLALILLLALGAVRASRTESEAVGVQAEHQAAESVDNQKSGRQLGPEIGKEAPPPQRDRETNKSEAGENTSEFWPPFLGYRFKVTDSLLVLFTGFLAWSTWGLQRSTLGLQRAADEQANITRQLFSVDQRPWLNVITTVAATPEYDAVACSITLNICIRCRNIGKSPALNAADGISQGHVGYEGFQEDFDTISRFVAVQSGSKGKTIFPGDETGFDTRVVLGKAAIEASKGIAEGLPMHFFTIGYAYGSSLSDELFETIRMYQFGIPRCQMPLPAPGEENWGKNIEFLLWKESVT